MRLSDTEYSLETREILSRVLERDEDILWCGSPGGKSPLFSSLPIFFFSLVWVAIPSFMVWSEIQQPGEEGIDPMIIIPFIFILIGLILPICVYRYHQRQKQSIYVLTAQRAVILTPKAISGTQVYCYPIAPDMLLEANKKKDGSGDLVFDYSDVVVNNRPLPRGFLKVADVEKPLTLLRQMGVRAGQESTEF